jgi:hypothetical protein
VKGLKDWFACTCALPLAGQLDIAQVHHLPGQERRAGRSDMSDCASLEFCVYDHYYLSSGVQAAAEPPCSSEWCLYLLYCTRNEGVELALLD